MDNQKDNLDIAVQPENTGLPFHEFFTLLKNNGFTITTQQLIDTNNLIIHYSGQVKNEEELCRYLLPVFATGEDEQLLFKQLFLQHFKTVRTSTGHTETKKEFFQKKIKKNWKRILMLYGLIALIVFILIIIAYRKYTTPDPSKIFVSLTDRRTTAKKGYSPNSFSVDPNQLLELNTVCMYTNAKGRFAFTSNTTFNWGDGSAVDNSNSHRYSSPGKYELVAWVEVSYDYKVIKRDTLHRLVLVCAGSNSLKIDYGGTNRITTNTSLQLKATVSQANPPDYIKWSSGDVDLHYGNTYQALFAKPGSYPVTCMAVYDSINSPCTLRQDLQFFVADQVKPDITSPDTSSAPATIPGAENTTPKKTASPFLFYLYLALALVFSALTILFTILYEKEKIITGRFKKAISDRYNQLSSSLQGKKTPGVIPFRNKNYLPLHQTEIHHAAKQMRKRVTGNSSYLHIGKTIARSIENNGLFQPVNLPRTRQTEYIVLVDEISTNSQMLKLFEYLLAEFKKQNILFTQYYYKDNPGYLYHFTEPKGISLEKLFERHQDHVLLIIGNAYQFIDNSYPAFTNDQLALLNRWQHKAILTPVPYPDWGIKEKDILMSHIPVFPLDVEGLLLMTEQFADNLNDRDIIARLKQHETVFYKTTGIDFEDITQLERYCNNAKWATRKGHGKPVNILFQWIAALAVYPSLSWEITITIGKSILDEYGYGHELNYTNLLRIARISWMQRGFLPGKTRLELLKKLTPDNERLARETMLVLLAEIPVTEIKETSSAWEEREIQQLINEFSLYAHDPVFYASYKQSGYMYEKLWNENKLADPVAASYFKNPDKSWASLINKKTPDNMGTGNTGIEEYFESLEEEDTILGKLYLWLALISLFVVVSSLFALRILYQWKTFTDV